MADIINRITRQYLKSVNTPDYPTSEWIINPILPDCDPSEWVIDKDTVRETTQEEKNKKISEEEAEREERKSKELLDKEKTEAGAAKNKENFIALSIEDKLLYLYDMR